MKIAVDARPLNFPHTGIGRYTYELLERVTDSEHEWHLLFTPRQDYEFLHRDNVIIHKLGNTNIQDFLLLNIFFHFLMRKQKVELFWSPRHHLPFFLSKEIKSILSIHDLVWKRAPGTMTLYGLFQERLFMPRSIRVATRITTVSFSTTKDIQYEFKVNKDNLTLISPAINNLFKVSNKHSLELAKISKPFILFVGTNEPRKNLERLIKAYGQLTEQEREKASLVIAGGKGWGKNRLSKLVKELHLSGYVYHIGYVNDEALISLYDNAMFLAFPSLYEGFGIPIVEAMSRGLPILTSNNSSMPEVAGQAGHFVDPFSVESIYDGLKKMINDSEYRNMLASQAKPKAKTYDWENSAKSFLEIIDEVSSV